MHEMFEISQDEKLSELGINFYEYQICSRNVKT